MDRGNNIITLYGFRIDLESIYIYIFFLNSFAST